jgi:DNA (cytosine-5)-methyltransferase 1
MRIGSLFSGIGGLELGLEMADVGETVWQVEKDDYCRAVLAKHWPGAERFDDVSTVGSATLSAVDLICGGFPCQDVSSAGKRAGLAGARSGLWFDFHRIVSELRPSWVVVENVASGARAWVDVVVAGLEQLGYACLPIPLAAADVGAPHERARIFIVAAHADAKSESARAEHAEVGGTQAIAADSNSPVIRLEPRRGSRSNGGCQTVAQHSGWRSAQPDMVRTLHGVPRGLDRPTNRIRALGNSVVPQCAEVIGHIIMELAR